MEYARFEEKYETYKRNRKKATVSCVRFLIIWGILLVPAIRLAVFLYEECKSASNTIEMILIGIPLVLISGFTILLPSTCWKDYRSKVNRMTYEMSLDMMESSLREKFGNFTKEQVNYRIFQSLGWYGAEVNNYRLAWLKSDSPFLVHRACIYDNDGDVTHVYFDGTAISVAVEDPFWRNANRYKVSERLEKSWKKTFCNQIAERPMFGLDEIEGRLWLTVGFFGLKLGEKDVDVGDLQRWYQQCQKNVELLNRALNLIRSITPASCEPV